MGSNMDNRKAHPLYNTWRKLRYRCNNKNTRGYENYGGRGISYDKRWDDFECFLEDIWPRPTEKHSLDRIDNDGNYCKSNIRWATRQEQNVNKRDTLAARKNLPPEYFGISYNKRLMKWQAAVPKSKSINNKCEYVGVFNSEKDAFIAVLLRITKQ